MTEIDWRDPRELAAWRARAARKLDAQVLRAARFLAYFDGEEEIPAILDTAERQTFRRLLREATAPWCELIVNAVAERLTVTGFRFGAGSDTAWAIWQANQMDADAELVQCDALVTGRGVCLVQPSDDNPSGVEITAESPLECAVLYEPGSRRRRVAGFKRFADDDGDGAARTEILILPGVIVTWEPGQPERVEPNPAAAVGMIEIIPQPRTKGWPRSELTPAIPIQDRINTTIWNRLVATDYGAFRQVWATGVKLARETIGADPDTGEARTRPVAPWDVGANRLLINENPAGRFGAMPGDPLAGYLAAVEQDVTQLAAITQTPPYYLAGAMINLSADAIKAAEAGLVAKVRRRMLHIGEDWETVMRTALSLVGDPAAADVAGEVTWADPETRSIAQLADALVKLQTLGVPTEVLWEKYGASPQEIARWRGMAADEQARTAANQAAALGAGDIAALLSGAGAGGG